MGGFSGVVSVTNCRDDLEDPVKSENVLGVDLVVVKASVIDPRLLTVYDKVFLIG